MDTITDLMDEFEKHGIFHQLEKIESKRTKNDLVRQLIIQISNTYGGDDEIFLERYVNLVLKEWSHDLDKALVCFRDLAKQEVPVNNRG